MANDEQPLADACLDAPSAAPAPEFSVLLSCYQEESSVEELLERLCSTLDLTGRDYEIVATDDGSRDGTMARLEHQFERRPRLACVNQLCRNSGQAAGLTAALQAARGRHIILLDSDLQLAPEDLPSLLAIFDDGADVVSGVRTSRKDGVTRRVTSWLANRLVRRVAGLETTDIGCTFKVLRGELVRAFGFGPTRPLSVVQVLCAAGRYREVPV